MAGELPSPDLAPNYAFEMGFEPALQRANFPYPSITIQAIPWLRETLLYFGVEHIAMDTFPLENGHTQCKISFTVYARAGNQRGEILYISRKGSGQYHLSSSQKYVVQECLKALERIGYNILTYSSTKMGALEVGLHHDIGTFYESIASNNINDVWEAYDLTYTSCNFGAIINQALHQLGGYSWHFGGPIFTSEGIQERIVVTRGGSGPLLMVMSRPCERSCEAKESALINTLIYISDICAYEINDLHFSEYVVRRHEVLGV